MTAFMFKVDYRAGGDANQRNSFTETVVFQTEELAEEAVAKYIACHPGDWHYGFGCWQERDSTHYFLSIQGIAIHGREGLKLRMFNA